MFALARLTFADLAHTEVLGFLGTLSIDYLALPTVAIFTISTSVRGTTL